MPLFEATMSRLTITSVMLTPPSRDVSERIININLRGDNK
jgi:hypothetical protein